MSYFPPITISTAIQKIEYKQYLLPAIQREFVWGYRNIELLFDSLMREYPFGSLLMWKVEGANKGGHRYYEVLKYYRERYHTHCEEVNTALLPDFEAVLDGQQRLTALYLGLKGSYAYKTYRLSWNDNSYSLPTRKLYLNLSSLVNQDDAEGDVTEDGRLYDFRFLTDAEVAEATDIWFEVGKILGIQGTFKLGQFVRDQQWAEIPFINETLAKLHDVVHIKPLIHYYLETDQDYEKALNIFIRINSGGEKLDYSDLIMSTTIAGWKLLKAREEINSLISEIWANSGIQISKDLVLRTYLMLFNEDIKFRVANFSMANAQEFEQHWYDIRGAISEGFQLIKDFGYSENTMTSKNAALPIIYYLAKAKKAEDFTKKVGYKADRDIIKRWLHAVLLHRIFGGQADSVLKIIRDCISDELGKGVEAFPAVAIAKKMSKTRKSITVDDEFIENLLYTRYEDRYAFPILALLYPYLDYKNGDFHKDHIHPVSQFSKRNLKVNGVDTEVGNGHYFKDADFYNGIVNMQLLDGNENKSKNDKMLSEWVAVTRPDLKRQLIPEMLEFEQFPEFVERRWHLLKEKLREILTFSPEQETEEAES
ncbi:uncharacterized protein with ParB-like and HNH nuclease domain [Dinghuibacter silviterrae]|uniref:Uncharacterized protein with ParB-like and HNH nuclease domain n=2 Tax=Dinghuibacter silviterrae TaxID=1539049 RepID=A0A4R8DVV2_9BACT|nr:uncharacterized protein with ParB-like and HNH nuclease domain [Dinghuibacter silviterrae]